MGYRHHEREYAIHINDTARKSLITVDNGTIAHIWVPCYTADAGQMPPQPARMEVGGGWPSPYQQCIGTFEPQDLDLTARDYDTIDVGLPDPPEGLVFTGSIEANVIKLTIVTMCPGAEAEDLEVSFSVFAEGTATEVEDVDTFDIRDVVTKGTLRIVAGPITNDVEEAIENVTGSS